MIKAPSPILLPKDMEVGKTIPVYGRQLFLYDADPATYAFYKACARAGAAAGPPRSKSKGGCAMRTQIIAAELSLASRVPSYSIVRTPVCGQK